MRRTRRRSRAAAHSVLVGHPPRHPGPWIERLEIERQHRSARPALCCAGDLLASAAWVAADAFRSSFEIRHRLQPTIRHAPPPAAFPAGSWLKRAGCLNAAEPEVLNRQQPLHRAVAGGLASQACAFAPSYCRIRQIRHAPGPCPAACGTVAWTGHATPRGKIRLTTPAYWSMRGRGDQKGPEIRCKEA
jgi:hypothetical protein